jgi:hydrogenase maturation protein HypF
MQADDLPTVRAFSQSERSVLARMLERGIASPLTTSAGRLFDAVASLAGLRQRSTFEGQAAMELEHAAAPGPVPAYSLPLLDSPDGTLVLDWEPMVEEVLADVRHARPVGEIAARFHGALAQAIVRVARRVAVARVALSGGCFQNRRLLEEAATHLERAGFVVLLHRQVPPNDGGIALGQVKVAAAVLDGTALS